ncbi:hypothetical protein FGADI_1643 [Fusarium gaditjirri]|uniref:Transaldolase n=1 Tax=Fusarium gaditjirri TaxID=282569 RepID=A0A8H4TKL6_9HYPO|nr:hypothetical protein FGADI_1643 [Fusarium gaditjirri]
MEEMTDILSSAGQDESSLDYVPYDTAAARLNLLIGPNDSQWVKKHKFFSERLKSETPIKDIIRENLTYHESRMLMPADRADVKELQYANTKRYEALLNNRFKGVEDSLATKLTMMYFGLPVAPMEDILKELSEAVGLTEEVPLYNIKPPLHFLTAHDRRNWGRDNLKAKEAFSWPVPVPKTSDTILSLRGGEGGSSPPATCDDRIAVDYVPSTETRAVPEEEWTYLYSIYGRIPFRPRKWRSFALVLRQLLHNKPDDIREKKYIFDLHVIDKKTGSRKTIRDQLPLLAESKVMLFLEKHFGHGSKDKAHKDCCTLFIHYVRKESDNKAEHWEPSKQQLETDTVRIGRSLGSFPNGPEEEAISYAYIPFPAINTPTFVASNHASQQYNAYFRAATDILFGRPMGFYDAGCSEYNHALFRLYDKNKPDASLTIPVVYGAMGLPQSAWELLHPLNNPGACWMIECTWLDPEVKPLIFPNYYPSPNPHLLANDSNSGDEYRAAFHPICEISTEAFDLQSSRKLSTVYVLEGDPTNRYRGGIKGLEILPKRGYCGGNKDAYGSLVGEKIETLSAWFLTMHPHFRPGHCRLFPAWHDGQEISVEMPPLTSQASQIFEAVYQLVSKTNYQRDMRQDHILLKETRCARSLQSRDTPSYLIRPDASGVEWHRVRESITSPNITVSFVKKSDVDWDSCLSENNIWGVRDFNPELYVTRPRLGEDTLEITNVEKDVTIDPAIEYPSSPQRLSSPDPSDKEVVERARSSYRTGAFVSPTLPHVEIREPPASKLTLPEAPTLYGKFEAEEEQEYDVGVLATSRPDWANKPYPTDRPQAYRPADLDSDSDIYGYSGQEDNTSVDFSLSGDAPRQRVEMTIPSDDRSDESSRGDDYAGSGEDGDDNEDVNGTEHVAASRPGPPQRPPGNFDVYAPREARERTWAAQPSIFANSRAASSPAAIGVPVTAAPAEKMLRTTNSGNSPMMPKANLTPNEQAELQLSLWATRNLLLKRTMQCVFEDCSFTFRADDHEARKQHTMEAHKSRMCPWCDEPMFEWWDKPQRMNHMREKHTRDLKNILGLVDEPIPRPMPATSRPSKPPQQPAGYPPRAVQTQSSQPFSLGHVPNPFATPRSAPPRQPAPVAHMVPSTAPNPARSLLYSGSRPVPPNLANNGLTPRPPPVATPASEKLPLPPHEQRAIERARKSRETQEARETLRRQKLPGPPRSLTNPLAWYDMTGPVAVLDPPQVCPLRDCPVPDISGLGSWGLWDHITNGHWCSEPVKCPFCDLPFFVVEGTDEEGKEIRSKRKVEDCTRHMDCHVYDLWRELQPVLERPNMVYSQNVGSPLSGEVETVRRIKPTAAEEMEARAQDAARKKADKEARAKLEQEAAARAKAFVEARKRSHRPPVKKCQHFGKCGIVIGDMSTDEYRRHIEKYHGEQQSDSFQSGDEDDGNADGDEDGEGEDESNNDGDSGNGNRGSSSKRQPSGRSRAIQESAQNASKSKSPSPTPRVTEVFSEDEVVDESNESTGAVVVTKKPIPKKPASSKPPSKKASNKRKAATQEIESAAESHSEVASTVSRGRRRYTKAREEPPEATASSSEAQGSEAQSSLVQGRAQSKKARKTRRTGEKDDQYEDDGYETDDYDEEPNEQGGKPFRRRAKSPDWVKKLGPEDPNFDPDDNMYCSKCLRKVPKKRSKSPNHSPIGRDAEVEAHTDKRRCCGIRNAPGSIERLPNRSGWIKGSDIPKALGKIKKSFRSRYPTYARTVYPTNSSDQFASVWRSDPNNSDNSEWWDIPWPPYEGDPPFPGSWEAPGLPWDNTSAGRKRRKMYTGVEVPDTAYTYQSDSDTDGSMHGTVPEDISNLNIDATPALKRPESAITSIEEATEEPAAKKPKIGTIPKRGRKASTQPSRASSRIRMQKTATASPAPSTVASRAASVAVAVPANSKAAPKAAPKPAAKPATKSSSKPAPKKAAGSKTAAPAPEPDYDSSDPDR